MLRISVKELLKRPQGSREHFAVDDSFEMPKESAIRLIGSAVGTATLMNVDEYIYVELVDVSARAEGTCDRCLSLFTKDILIKEAGREYYLDDSSGEPLQVNKETLQVDIQPMLAEEILLHFPPIPVCSDSCLGLCVQCGKKLNEGACEHDIT